jgi:hypothetical protein
VEATPPPDSTPKKLLFWENRGNETQRLEEELMTTRIREMEVLTELKELRLKVMELETQVRGRERNSCSDNNFLLRWPIWKVPDQRELAMQTKSFILQLVTLK